MIYINKITEGQINYNGYEVHCQSRITRPPSPTTIGTAGDAAVAITELSPSKWFNQNLTEIMHKMSRPQFILQTLWVTVDIFPQYSISKLLLNLSTSVFLQCLF